MGFSRSKCSRNIIFCSSLWIRSRFSDPTLCRWLILKFWLDRKLGLDLLEYFDLVWGGVFLHFFGMRWYEYKYLVFIFFNFPILIRNAWKLAVKSFYTAERSFWGAETIRNGVFNIACRTGARLVSCKIFGEFFFYLLATMAYPPRLGIYQTWAPGPIRGGLGRPEPSKNPCLPRGLTAVPAYRFWIFLRDSITFD